jgi:hypothetical protein
MGVGACGSRGQPVEVEVEVKERKMKWFYRTVTNTKSRLENMKK